MLTQTTLQITAAVIIWIVSLIAGVGPVRIWMANPEHKSLVYAEALAAGIFLGAALFHMLPDAEREFRLAYNNNQYPYANLLCAISFTCLLFLETFSSRLIKNISTEKFTPIIPYALIGVLSVHAISEGIALGINTLFSHIVIIFVAILAHKSSESFALATQLVKSKISLTRIIKIFLLFSLATPIGILFGAMTIHYTQSHIGKLLQATFNALAAGTFLYLATLHKIHHYHLLSQNNKLYEFAALITGLATMALVAIWA